MPSFTVEAWCADTSAQGGLSEIEVEEQRRALNTQKVKAGAILDGRVTKGAIGDLPVEIYGGEAGDRAKALAALKTDLTKGGKVAKQMSEELLSRRTADGRGVRPVSIVLSRQYGSYSVPGSSEITVDIANDLGAGYKSKVPGGKFTYERILAHELGHAALGYLDYTVDPTYNIRMAENPIMNATGDHNDRIHY